MAIIKRSRKSVLGLDIQLNNMVSNLNNVTNNLSTEIERAKGVENDFDSTITNLHSKVSLLDSDENTVGSIEKKIKEAMSVVPTTDATYSKTDVDEKLSKKLDNSLLKSIPSITNKVITESELNTKAESNMVYSKTDVNDLVSTKADNSTTYSKSDIDSITSKLATVEDTYTNTEIDSLISPKVNSSDIYNRVEIDDLMVNKIDTTTTVSEVSNTNKIVTMTELNLKANVSDVYDMNSIDNKLENVVHSSDIISVVSDNNKIITQTELNLKADSAVVYTKEQIDDVITKKANQSTVGKIGPSLKTIDESDIADGMIISYNASSGNLEYIVAADPDASTIDDNGVSTESTYSSKKIVDLVGDKADKTEIYTQSEIDEKMVASSAGIKYSVDDLDALNNLTGMVEGEQAVINDARKVYKYDGSSWVEFYTLDGDHNHDDLYYTKSTSDDMATLKANKVDVYDKSDIDTKLDLKAPTTDLGKIGVSLTIVDEDSKADKKILSYNSTTDRLEYVDQDGSNIIEDTQTSDQTTFSSTKITNEINLKANESEIYKKSIIDDKLSNKVNYNEIKSTPASDNKIITETELSLKADTTNVYNKSEIDSKVNSKVNTIDVKTATSDTNKIVTESDISGKADVSSVYNKVTTDDALALKSNITDVYSKSETDTLMNSKLNTDKTITAVNDDNKIVTANEIVNMALTTNVYSQTELDTKLSNKFDNDVALSTVSTDNKIVTSNELNNKVDNTLVKTAVSTNNKIVTESDLSTAISSSEAKAPTAPFIVVDRPKMITKSSSDLDYIFTFPITRTPHGLVAVNDEITIYNFEENGDATIFENIQLFTDKHGEIAVTLNNTDEESKYNNIIKVCYLTTATEITPGTDIEHPIIIDVELEFEKQDGSETNYYTIDYNKGNYYKINFTDEYYTIIVKDTNHTNFHNENDKDYQADHYNADGIKSTCWPSIQDEVQYIDYNWTMSLEQDNGEIYKLGFTRNDAVGGGAL